MKKERRLNPPSTDNHPPSALSASIRAKEATQLMPKRNVTRMWNTSQYALYHGRDSGELLENPTDMILTIQRTNPKSALGQPGRVTLYAAFVGTDETRVRLYCCCNACSVDLQSSYRSAGSPFAVVFAVVFAVGTKDKKSRWKRRTVKY
jgi:hypothetical protein